MLKTPRPSVFSKQQINFFIALIAFIGVTYAVMEFLVKPKHQVPERTMYLIQGSDTTELDISGWDSTDIDSLMRTQSSEPTQEDDSLTKAYGLDLPDSLDNARTAPWLDSLIFESNKDTTR